MEEKLRVEDPVSGNTVRFTDNGAKEGDLYPEWQDPRPLLLDPAGAPYRTGVIDDADSR